MKVDQVGEPELKNEVYQLVGFFSVSRVGSHSRVAVELAALQQSVESYSLVVVAKYCHYRWGISEADANLVLGEDHLFGGASFEGGKDFVFAQFSGSKKKGSKEGYSTWWLHPFRRTGKVYVQAMTKIALRNDLEGKDVNIREGNLGSTRELCTLKPGRTFDIHKDPNATYREFIFIALPDNTKLRVLTSDDFAESKKISIYEEDGKYDWMTTERNSAPGDTAQGGLVKRLLRKFGLQ